MPAICDAPSQASQAGATFPSATAILYVGLATTTIDNAAFTRLCQRVLALAQQLPLLLTVRRDGCPLDNQGHHEHFKQPTPPLLPPRGYAGVGWPCPAELDSARPSPLTTGSKTAWTHPRRVSAPAWNAPALLPRLDTALTADGGQSSSVGNEHASSHS